MFVIVINPFQYFVSYLVPRLFTPSTAHHTYVALKIGSSYMSVVSEINGVAYVHKLTCTYIYYAWCIYIYLEIQLSIGNDLLAESILTAFIYCNFKDERDGDSFILNFHENNSCIYCIDEPQLEPRCILKS